METDISGLTIWLRFGWFFKNLDQTEIRFPHIPIEQSLKLYIMTWVNDMITDGITDERDESFEDI